MTREAGKKNGWHLRLENGSDLDSCSDSEDELGMYYDLNIPYPAATLATGGGTGGSAGRKGKAKEELVPPDDASRAELVRTLRLAVHLGAQCVALNHVVRGKLTMDQSCPIRPVEKMGSLIQLTRCTVILDDPDVQGNHNNGFNSSNPTLAKYDILAVCPLTQAAFQYACTSASELIDIIQLPVTLFSTRPPFFLKRSLINAARQRGVRFEVTYGPAMRVGRVNTPFNEVGAGAARKGFVSGGRDFVRVNPKGRGLVLSSGAYRANELRGPIDVVNLGCLLGLDQGVAHSAISEECRQIVLHGRTRTSTFRAAVGFTPGGSLPEPRPLAQVRQKSTPGGARERKEDRLLTTQRELKRKADESSDVVDPSRKRTL